MEVHPKRMSWIVKRLSFIVGTIAILLIVIAAVQYRKKSVIGEHGLVITIIKNDAGNKFVRERDVTEILFNEFRHAIVGQPLELIDIKEVEEVLESDIFIKDADVYIDALNNINIKVTQRHPILRVMDVEDETYYLDREGKQIPFSTKYTARTLVTTGDIGLFNEGYLDLEENRLHQVFDLAIEIIANPFLKVQVEQIHVDHSGDVILVPKVGNHKIYFGNPALAIQDKLYRLQKFYEEGLPYEGWEKYKSISLAFDKQVVAKKR